MAKSISIQELNEELNKISQEEFERYKELINKVDEDTKKQAIDLVKSKSPTGKTKRKRRYKNGWTSTTEKGNLMNRVIIHNAKDWQLTHLLEDGHFIFNQHGGAYGRTKEQPHIEPTQEEIDEIYYNNLINIIKGE